MDHPQRDILFTSTEDGVDIAYWEIGEGKPVVILNNFGNCHAELEWSVPSIASFYVDMAERYRVIRFDPRGIGLSGQLPGGWRATTASRGQTGMSIDEMGFDISAVTAALGLTEFALIGIGVAGPVAIQYTATHPSVTELILCDTMANNAKGWMGPILRAEIAVAEIEDEAGGSVFTAWERIGPRDETDRLVNLARTAFKQGSAKASVERAQLEWNAESLLPEVSVPTLILSARHIPQANTLGDARQLAARIAGAQLRAVSGGGSPYWSDRAATLEAVHAFLQPEPSNIAGDSGFRTIVFTDIVGSTEYVRRVGDEAGRAAIRALEQQIASLAHDHGGRVVKNLGDGSLVSFASNSAAISFALDVQETCGDGPLQLRIGMAAGEPLQEDGDIHGTVVSHASRIGDLGDAGEVIVSDSVRQLAAGKGFKFEPYDDVSLKGFDEPERVWKVVQTRPT